MKIRLIMLCCLPAMLTMVADGLITPAAASAEEGAAQGPSYIRMKSVSVSALNRGRVRGLVTVRPVLEVGEGASAASVEAARPRLRDAFYRVLNQMAATYIDVERPLDLDFITRVLQNETDRLVGPHGATVLLALATARRQ